MSNKIHNILMLRPEALMPNVTSIVSPDGDFHKYIRKKTTLSDNYEIRKSTKLLMIKRIEFFYIITYIIPMQQSNYNLLYRNLYTNVTNEWKKHIREAAILSHDYRLRKSLDLLIMTRVAVSVYHGTEQTIEKIQK